MVKMPEERLGIAEFLKDRELGYSLGLTRMAVKQNLPKIDLRFFQLGETKEGDLVEAPRWVAEVLCELGLSEVQEEGFEVELFRALSREKIQRPDQLLSLEGDFYVKMKRHLKSLKLESKKGGSEKDFSKVSAVAYDFLSLRLAKLLPLASSSSLSPELVERLTPEERGLFIHIQQAVAEWREAVLGGAS